MDDHFDEHPKFSKAGPLGMALWLAGMAYCNRNQTDGHIPWAKAQALVSWQFLDPGAPAQVFEIQLSPYEGTSAPVTTPFIIGLLVSAGLWEEERGGYYVHDYPEYQPTKAQLEKLRESRRAAGKAGGKAKAQSAASKPLANVKQSASNVPSKILADPVANDLAKTYPGPGPVKGTSNEVPAGDSADAASPEREVFEYYKAKVQPRAQNFPRDKIRTRLKHYSVEDLKRGIDHFAADWWWMEKCATNGAAWFFENDARTEQFLLHIPRPAKPVPPMNGYHTPERVGREVVIVRD